MLKNKTLQLWHFERKRNSINKKMNQKENELSKHYALDSLKTTAKNIKMQIQQNSTGNENQYYLRNSLYNKTRIPSDCNNQY
ncbi:hypothetical protein PT23B2_00530 [Acinetobacter towneri]